MPAFSGASASPVLPMLAKPVARVPGSDAVGGPFSYEPKWDGFRAIVQAGADGVEIFSRSGKAMTRYFPDVVAAVAEEFEGPDLAAGLLLDGEIVLARGPRLDFELLGQRIHPAASRVAMLAEHAPATLVVFDLLAAGGRDLAGEPLRERLAALDALAIAGPRVQVTPRSLDAPVAERWLAEFEGAGLDGVIAKPLDAPYAPGKRTMLKIKHARTADVVLAGYREHKESTPEAPLIGSLLLGLWEGEELQFVGVSASFPKARRAELIAELAPLAIDVADHEAMAAHPWGAWADSAAHESGRKPGAVSRWSGGKDLSFTPLLPERVLEVGYDHMEGTRFRHTTQFKRWRPDREPRSCTYEQLEEVVGYDLAEILPGAPAAAEDFRGAL